jgi:5'(3')-deoxyribonucleotidase
MTQPTLALDLDSTLAATWDVAFDLLEGPDHNYSYDDIEAWDWGAEEFGYDRFLPALWNAWSLRPHEISPMEEALPATTAELSDHFEIDVVTNQPDHLGISRGKKWWLDHHGIEYDEFVAVPSGETKATYGYDYIVDDKPALPQEVMKRGIDMQIFLRDQPYNSHVKGPYQRVNSIEEVLERIVMNA